MIALKGEHSVKLGHASGDGQTIFAVASGAGRAAIAVVRISGAGTEALVRGLCGRRLPPSRRASLRRLRSSAGQLLDVALVLWLPGPTSYTGEDSAELHLHGGPAVLDGVCAALTDLHARPAEPGEFTRRAFLNGRMELTEAEAVADLIAAETASQREQALHQLDGALGAMFDGLGHRLKSLLAEQEALIDFPDETSAADGRGVRIHGLIADLHAQIEDSGRGERLRQGLVFAITGPPNAGKSSLINALTERDAAIVAATPGTTRDVLEVRTVLGGVPVTLLDTAGLRDSDDPVEAEGIRRARRRAAAADCVITVHEAGREDASGLGTDWVRAANKIDLAPASDGWIGISAMTGQGIAALRAALDQRAQYLTSRAGPPPLTRARHRAACLEAVAHLHRALDTSVDELRAEELRLAMVAIGRVSGKVGVEDVLDSVFSQFCIGK